MMNATRKIHRPLGRSVARAAILTCTGMIVLCLVHACAGSQATGESIPVAVIVHPGNAIDTLSDHELRRIFSRREVTWPVAAGLAERTIIAIDLGRHDPAREVFSRAIFEGSTASVRQLWIAQGLTNARRPPPERPALKVLDLVSRVPNTIGYVPARLVSSRVKVIRTL